MAQHAILRFEKHKGHPAGPLEAHHERKKEQYASNPDIDTSRSKYNFHIVKPDGRYYHFIQSRIEQARCRTRKDSTRFVDTLITASPEFFKGKSPKEIAAYFQRAADFLIDRVGRENIVSAMVHMDEKTPHLHLVFVPLTKDNRLCAKEIIGNRANVIERLNREIRRRTRVVGSFPDGNSALMLVCARLRHVAGSQWGNKKYMNMKHLEAAIEDASIAG